VDLAVIGIAFAAIFVVELPDKTFIAALVLATRYRPLAVWVGVGLAFLVQTLLAVTVGQVVTFLPDQVVQAVTLVIFLLGAVLLFREAPKADSGEAATEEEFASKATPAADGRAKTGLAAVTASFLVLFAAEWGDLSQLLTISLVGRFQEPVSVFVGAWGALLAVSGLAVLVGRILLRHVKLSVVHYVGASVCLLLAAITAYELIR
jgi:putative Ca2+/H+ antiporter (TMEM165/GDT1 family)